MDVDGARKLMGFFLRARLGRVITSSPCSVAILVTLFCQESVWSGKKAGELEVLMQ